MLSFQTSDVFIQDVDEAQGRRSLECIFGPDVPTAFGSFMARFADVLDQDVLRHDRGRNTLLSTADLFRFAFDFCGTVLIVEGGRQRYRLQRLKGFFQKSLDFLLDIVTLCGLEDTEDYSLWISSGEELLLAAAQGREDLAWEVLIQVGLVDAGS